MTSRTLQELAELPILLNFCRSSAKVFSGFLRCSETHSVYDCQNIGRSGTETGAKKKGRFFLVVVGFKLSDQEGVRNVIEVIFKSQMFEASIF